MSATVVTCSLSGCRAEATYRVASPWQDGPFAELQTLGYTCPDHTSRVVAQISRRPSERHPGPGEIRVYNLPRA